MLNCTRSPQALRNEATPLENQAAHVYEGSRGHREAPSRLLQVRGPAEGESCTGFKLPVCVRWQADFLQGGSVCRKGFPRLCMGFNSEVFDQPSHQVVRVYIRLCLRPEIAEPTPKAGVSAGMWKLLRQMRTSSSAGASGNVLEERAEAPAKPESRLICMEGILMLDLGLKMPWEVERGRTC